MSSVAVVHPDLTMRGGAERVCLATLRALQDAGRDVTLVTLSDPDFDSLAGYYDVDVARPTVVEAGTVGPWLNSVAQPRLSRLQAGFLGRYVARRSDRFDLVLSTKNEFPLADPGIQYVHHPQFRTDEPVLDRDSLVKSAYNEFARRIVRFDPARVRHHTLLANSNWTATLVERLYGVEPATVYPPVDVSGFDPRPWVERERGFVTLGRIEPSKRTLDTIRMMDELRDRGHDVHLHILGPAGGDDYARQVVARAETRSYVYYEGAVSRSRLATIVSTHRYGLHARPYEHFGISVAELAGSGAITFAPDSGGQREILDEDERLLYRSVEDAVRKIDRVLSDPDMQADLVALLDDVSRRYSPKRFRNRIADIVARATP